MRLPHLRAFSPPRLFFPPHRSHMHLEAATVPVIASCWVCRSIDHGELHGYIADGFCHERQTAHVLLGTSVYVAHAPRCASAQGTVWACWCADEASRLSRRVLDAYAPLCASAQGCFWACWCLAAASRLSRGYWTGRHTRTLAAVVHAALCRPLDARPRNVGEGVAPCTPRFVDHWLRVRALWAKRWLKTRSACARP